jgi:hypothetical protein
VLDYLTLEREFNAGRFSRIEFCTNAGPELIRWGDQSRSVSHINVYRNKYSRHLVHSYRKLKRLLSQSSPASEGNPNRLTARRA